MPDFDHGIPAGTYKAALLVEAAIPNLPKERRAAILAELEGLGNVSTADENRAGVETAAGGSTVGRAPAAAPLQAPNPDPVAPAQGRHADGDLSGR